MLNFNDIYYMPWGRDVGTQWYDITKWQPEAGRQVVYRTKNGNIMYFRNGLKPWHVDKYNLTHWLYVPQLAV
jgi:hypothetical protein